MKTLFQRLSMSEIYLLSTFYLKKDLYKLYEHVSHELSLPCPYRVNTILFA